MDGDKQKDKKKDKKKGEKSKTEKSKTGTNWVEVRQAREDYHLPCQINDAEYEEREKPAVP